jgi:hypothetical protein
MISEMMKMKFQQQSIIKSMVKSVAPDIDSLLLQASKSLDLKYVHSIYLLKGFFDFV